MTASSTSDFPGSKTEELGDPHAEASQTLEAIVAASPAALVCVDPAAKVTLWNHTAERMFGWSAQEVLGRLLPSVPDFEKDAFRAVHQSVLQGETHLNVEAHGMRKSGAVFPISLSMAPLRNASGDIRGSVSIVLDITTHRQSEEQIRLLAAALEATANAVVIMDRAGKMIWMNPAFTAITGYPANEALGKTLEILNSGKHPPGFFENLWRTIQAGRVWRGEIINRRKDGSLYTEEQTITPVRDERGEIAYYIAIQQDITENKKLTQQLAQAQKMESVGQLAGGVAHDFNNLLSVIIGYAEMLLEDPANGDKKRKQIDEVLKAARRAASLTRQLLAFSRQQVLEPRVLNLNNCVVEIEKMLRRLIGEDVELLTTLHATLGSVKADPGQIEQVIMNLAVNARDAMPNGGKLIIETSNADLDEDYALQHPPLAAGRYILLSVTDTGMGMSQEVKGHIFEPFFTTKEVGKGTGLGLATVYGVVKQSNGYIWVYSEPGQGSAFKIYLPRIDGTEEENRPAHAALEFLQGTETILLVEDEQSVRVLTRSLLEQGGYTVLEADNGEQAIELAKQHSGLIHLLLTDVVMPGMKGPTLAEKILQIHPESKALYVSGYSGSFGTQTGLVPAGSNFLQKPFSKVTLLKKLREALSTPMELRRS